MYIHKHNVGCVCVGGCVYIKGLCLFNYEVFLEGYDPSEIGKAGDGRVEQG